jgi:hypothetical protein
MAYMQFLGLLFQYTRSANIWPSACSIDRPIDNGSCSLAALKVATQQPKATGMFVIGELGMMHPHRERFTHMLDMPQVVRISHP